MNLLRIIGRNLRRFKYFWAVGFFILIAGFLDPNSYLRRLELAEENERLSEEIRVWEERIKRDDKQLRELKNDPNARVRVAREVHLMKSDDEDVFYITPSAPADSATTPTGE